ncbi:hypothetical protein L3Y34_009240 [Caenorhabditis briggsae]|uniref:Uncharacterized protein n=1 Tax=Caenorhabditis briggsae TaxID=6238 RepID=A0AAE9A3R8_CAEBR|nr:hypothetical protein L3Y34_009240 [Caenorhabditis briggsae]
MVEKTENINMQQELAEDFDEFQTLLKESKIDGIAKTLNAIVGASLAYDEDFVIAGKAVKALATYIDKSGIYKNHFLMKKLRQGLDSSAKILLAREIGFSFKPSQFSLNCLIAYSEVDTDQLVITKTFEKLTLPHPMAFGKNGFGKLGTGDDSDAEVLRKIDLEDSIYKVCIGNEHTMFLTIDGDFYGAGKTQNFKNLDDSKNGVKPWKLDYIHGLADDASQDFFIRDSKTVFYGCRRNYSEIERSDGGITLKEKKLNKLNTWVADGRDVLHEDPANPSLPVVVTVTNHLGNPEKIDIYPELLCGCFDSGLRLDIVWIVNGVLIPRDKIKKKAYFATTGIVWVHDQNTLYRGRIQIIRTEDSGTHLIVSLQEVQLMYSVHGFAVSPDGESVIIWPPYVDPQPPKVLHPNKLGNNVIKEFECIDPNPPLKLSCQIPGLFEACYAEFKHSIDKLWPGKIYTYTGYPTALGMRLIPHLRRLQVFLMDERPWTMYDRNDHRILGPDILPVVVQAGWSPSIRGERVKQILEKERQMLNYINQNIACICEEFRKGRRNNKRMYEVKNRIYELIMACTECNQEPNRFVPEIGIEKVTGCNLEVKDIGRAFYYKAEKKEIDSKNERFKILRIEAVDHVLRGEETLDYIPRMMFSTREHVKMVDEDLLKFIDGDVLNLNQVSTRDYNELVDEFFATEDENDLESPTCTNSTPTPVCPEMYLIATNDAKLCSVPRILFEAHSAGYDGMRLRGAERNKEYPNFFKLDAYYETIEHLKLALRDSRNLKFFSQEQLLNLLDVCRYCLFDVLINKIIWKIVQKTEESCPEALRNIFFYHPDITSAVVGKDRPEIILAWNGLQDIASFSQCLFLLGQALHHFHFQPSDGTPLPMLAPEKINNCPPIEVLKQVLMAGETDKIVLEDFEESYAIWSGQPTQDCCKTELE